MSTATRFDAFLKNINLTPTQITEGSARHKKVRDILDVAFYTRPSSATTSILIGSYAKNTAVRPPHDIDILFIMPLSLFSKYNDYRGNGQSWLLQDVKNALQKQYPKTDIRGDGQVVVVDFADSFYVEVAPVFATTDAQIYCTADTNAGGSWGRTNPSAENTNVSYSNTDSKGNTVHLIKMMKVWKRFCSVPLTSFALELMVVQFLTLWQYKGNSSVYYDWMVRDFLTYMLTRVGAYEIIPGIAGLYALGEDWESRTKTALARAQKACEYETKSDETLADAEWVRIFGDFFTGRI